jgi:murein DD-endopeptidase MepM/ murein hydrolase activator NlpD
LPNTLETDHYWLKRPVGEDGIVWTDKFYPYGSSRGGTLRAHHGVEFNVPYDTPILAAASGTVIVAGNDRLIAFGPETDFYGNLVVIELDSRLEDDRPVYTLYGHLNEILVQKGQHVGAEQVIGLSGATGVADGAHMHFEVRVGFNNYDTTRNPLLWLYPFPDRGTVAGRVVWADGSLARDVPVQLRPLAGGANTAVTSTYVDDSVHSDPQWNENFVMDDVYAGSYEVVIEIGEEKFTQTVEVQIYRTSFVEITIMAEELETEETETGD